MSANNNAADAPTLPTIDWPTWSEDGPETLPAEAYLVGDHQIPAEDLADHLAELGAGSREIMVGRLDPADDHIDYRSAGWITVRPDGAIDHEPAD